MTYKTCVLEAVDHGSRITCYLKVVSGFGVTARYFISTVHWLTIRFVNPNWSGQP